ncbi:MAG: TIGR02996 domain-containing protein [Gemmataceae bacterium]|nr:TIGR02996 domain-containing protein [Gemmataceae bacterium]
MTDEDALLTAIAAAPADDTPRLVYADWLEDRGDPRAEYVRLEVERNRLKPRGKDGRAELNARLEALRPLADPHWLPRIDRTTRYSYYLSQPACRQIESDEMTGQPLPELGSQAFPKAAGPGDYVYAVACRGRRLYLVTRMRIDDHFVVMYPPYSSSGTFTSREGVPVRFDREVPNDALSRIGWYSGKLERRLVLDDTGRIATHAALQGVLRLTPATAAKFDALLRAG